MVLKIGMGLVLESAGEGVGPDLLGAMALEGAGAFGEGGAGGPDVVDEKKGRAGFGKRVSESKGVFEVG